MRGTTNAVPAAVGGLKIIASASVILEADTRQDIALPAGVKVLFVIASGNGTGWAAGAGECPMVMLVLGVVDAARAGNLLGVRTLDGLRSFQAWNDVTGNRLEIAYLALG